MRKIIQATILMLALLPATAEAFDFETGPVGYDITSPTTVALAGIIEDYWRASGPDVYLQIPGSIGGHEWSSLPSRLSQD